jgi:hypothetical protein
LSLAEKCDEVYELSEGQLLWVEAFCMA